MRIESLLKILPNSDQQLNTSLKLLSGQTIKAQIIDKTANEILLNIAGKTLVAESKIDLPMGALIEFRVKEVSNDKIILEIVSQNSEKKNVLETGNLTELSKLLPLPHGLLQEIFSDQGLFSFVYFQFSNEMKGFLEIRDEEKKNKNNEKQSSIQCNITLNFNNLKLIDLNFCYYTNKQIDLNIISSSQETIDLLKSQKEKWESILAQYKINFCGIRLGKIEESTAKNWVKIDVIV